MKTVTEQKPATELVGAYFMNRPRLDNLLKDATELPLIYVIAGTGYGKTQTVRNYLNGLDNAVIRWITMTAADNICSRFWENLTYSVSSDNPELAARFREIGFPETIAQFGKFISAIKELEHKTIHTFFVLDDYHLIVSQQIAEFVRRCANTSLSGSHMIIISRSEPIINYAALLSKRKIGIITEDALCFAEDEIKNFFELREIKTSPPIISRVYTETKGWAFAVQLLSISLGRARDNQAKALDSALGTMKQTIFKFMENEAFENFTTTIKKILVKVSLVTNLPITPLDELSGGIPVLETTRALASFFWYDSLVGGYEAHPLYMEFLQTKKDILSDKEKEDVYRFAVGWCDTNGYTIDAIDYNAKLRDYAAIIKSLLSRPFKLPRDVAEYILRIIDRLDADGMENGNLDLIALKTIFIPRLLTDLGKYGKASEYVYSAIKEIGELDTPITHGLLATCYNNLAYIAMYTCVFTNRYDAPEFLKKAAGHFAMISGIKPHTGQFVCAHIPSCACLVGVAAGRANLSEFIEAAREMVKYLPRIMNGQYYGYDDLAACELAYVTGNAEETKFYAIRAMEKAHEKNQYGIAMMAANYMLRQALHEGDASLAAEMLQQLKIDLDKEDFWNRHMLYDLFMGTFFAQTGIPTQAPSWLLGEQGHGTDWREDNSGVHIPAREMITIIKLLLATKKYYQALVLLSKGPEGTPDEERFLFSELTIYLLSAVAHAKTSNTEGAIEDFEHAYKLSFEGYIETPFVELGHDMHTLAGLVTGKFRCGVPEAWAKTIDRKATAYAKNAAVVAESYRRRNKIEKKISLSEREQQLLGDLYKGLSREEIAASRYLSINTVKTLLNSLYIKLEAANNVEAVRIAIEKKLI